MNNNTPLVTVLMPAYNAEPYINASVDSVLNQTYKDFELLIINDGSKDKTREILESYSDSRIKLVHQENMGLVKTLNKGIELASGKYIARFDADDICYPERLQKQMDFLTKNPDYILVGSEADYTDEYDNFIFTYRFSLYENDEIQSAGFKQCPFIHSSVTLSKDAIIKAGKYSEKAITFEDHLLWSRIAEYGKVKNLHEPLIRVRFNPDSVTIDEKWRGREFIDLKQRSIKNGEVSDEDLKLLKTILANQNFTEYKKASYHGMLGKKFLWNQHNPKKARQHLRVAMKMMPGKLEPYLLYILSYMPASLVKQLYKFAKSKQS